MAHMLSTASGRTEMFYTGQTPWHKLGTQVDTAPDSATAMQLAGLDWRVGLAELSARLGGVDISGVPGYAVVREDTRQCFGVVGTRYKPIQNAEAFAFLDSAVAGGETRYETAGALDQGQRVWMLARMPDCDFSVGTDDAQKSYALLSASHDGTSAVRVMPTSVRVVCNNTLTLALSRSQKSLSIRHTGEIRSKLDAAQQVLGTVRHRMAQAREEIQRLAKVQLTDTQARTYWEDLLPTDAYRIAGLERPVVRELPSGGLVLDAILGQSDSVGMVDDLLSDGAKRRLEAAEREAERNRAALESIVGNYHNPRNTLPGISGTAWAAYNAVSEWTDHQRTYRGRDGMARRESRLDSVLWGASADLKQQAYSAALSLAS